MPPFSWPNEPMQQVQKFEAKHKSPEAGALFAWAAWTVDCLHYLDDVDTAFNQSPTSLSGHRPDVVDVAHARWATGTSITATDLCAAGLARAFCGHTGPKELDLVDFDLTASPSTEKNARRALLPPPALQWVDSVIGDPDYGTTKAARDWLTHSRLKRHFTLDAGGPPQRLELELPSARLPVRRLVELSRDLATRHVSALLGVLPSL